MHKPSTQQVLTQAAFSPKKANSLTASFRAHCVLSLLLFSGKFIADVPLYVWRSTTQVAPGGHHRQPTAPHAPPTPQPHGGENYSAPRPRGQSRYRRLLRTAPPRPAEKEPQDTPPTAHGPGSAPPPPALKPWEERGEHLTPCAPRPPPPLTPLPPHSPGAGGHAGARPPPPRPRPGGRRQAACPRGAAEDPGGVYSTSPRLPQAPPCRPPHGARAPPRPPSRREWRERGRAGGAGIGCGAGPRGSGIRRAGPRAACWAL